MSRGIVTPRGLPLCLLLMASACGGSKLRLDMVRVAGVDSPPTLEAIYRSREIPLVVVGDNAFMPPCQCLDDSFCGTHQVAGATERASVGGSVATANVAGASATPTTGGATAPPPAAGGATAPPAIDGQSAAPTAAGTTAPPTHGGDVAPPPKPGGATAVPTASGVSEAPVSGGATAQPIVSGAAEQPKASGATEHANLGGARASMRCQHVSNGAFKVLAPEGRKIRYFDSQGFHDVGDDRIVHY
jgi:hypothetical protein